MVAAIILNPTHGAVGTVVTVTGSGFQAAADTITFTFAGVSITANDAPITDDGAGNFTAHLTVPEGLVGSVQGDHAVIATDAHANSGSANFTIDPKVVLSPVFGNTGVTVTATLSGYAATSALTATFNGVSVTLSSTTTDAHGVLAPTFTVPTKGVLDGANVVSIHDAVPNTATASFELYLATSGITMNSTFTHLNGRNLYIKPTTTSREREAIVNIAFDATDEYETGGMPLDFSGIQHFTQVYLCSVVHKTYGLGISFVAGAGNGASLGKLKFFDSSGVELSSGNTAIQNVSLLCRIRGI